MYSKVFIRGCPKNILNNTTASIKYLYQGDEKVKPEQEMNTDTRREGKS